nr:hypothetical protein [Planomicrobium sp. YIM 101495]
MVTDYVEDGSSLYIQVEIRDGETELSFRGEVRFLEELLYGDLIHPTRSPLSDSCRTYSIGTLRKHFGR